MLNTIRHVLFIDFIQIRFDMGYLCAKLISANSSLPLKR